MYKGSVRKLQMTRSVKCDKCSGSGSKSGKRYTCEVRAWVARAAAAVGAGWRGRAPAGCPAASVGVQMPAVLPSATQPRRSVPTCCLPAARPVPACRPTQTCHGSGVEMKLRALGPGMVQQIQQRCSRCGGGGYSCPAADKCGQCEGRGLAPEKKVFEVRQQWEGRAGVCAFV